VNLLKILRSELGVWLYTLSETLQPTKKKISSSKQFCKFAQSFILANLGRHIEGHCFWGLLFKRTDSYLPLVTRISKKNEFCVFNYAKNMLFFGMQLPPT